MLSTAKHLAVLDVGLSTCQNRLSPHFNVPPGAFALPRRSAETFRLDQSIVYCEVDRPLYLYEREVRVDWVNQKIRL